MDIQQQFIDALESYVPDDEVRDNIVRRCIEICEQAIKENEEINCDLFDG